MAKKTEKREKIEKNSEQSKPAKKTSSRKRPGRTGQRGFEWDEVDDEELGEVLAPISSGKKKRKRRKSDQSSEGGAETRFQVYQPKPPHVEDLSLPSYGRLPTDEDDAYSNLEALFGGDDDSDEGAEAPVVARKKTRKKSTKKKVAKSSQSVSEPTKKEAPKSKNVKRSSESGRAPAAPKERSIPVTSASPDKQESSEPKPLPVRKDDVTPRRVRGIKRRAAARLRDVGVDEKRIDELVKLGETSPVSVLFHMLETLLDSLDEKGKSVSAKGESTADVPLPIKASPPDTAPARVPVPTKTVVLPVTEPLVMPEALGDRKGTRSRPRKKKGKRPAVGESIPVEQVQAAAPVPSSTEKKENQTGFALLGLSEAMLRTLSEAGYESPTPVQSGTIEHVLGGIDLIGQAKTGTGKTAAFAIPIIEQICQCQPGDKPVALVVVPTRELAVQVRDEMLKLSANHELAIVACYGGKPISDQTKKLAQGVDVVVGTPGRIIDLARRRALLLSDLRWVVLDEADRMLDIGFRPDIERILKLTPLTRQTLLFSATLPPPVIALAKKYMKDPQQFDFSEDNISSETIEQYYVTVDAARKFDALIHLLEKEQPRQAIVFCRTKRAVDRIGNHLQKIMQGVSLIHGDLSQEARDRVMKSFRTGSVGILVATDVVGRGIDVSGISHIINYDVPVFCDDYVHRVGRTGRMGREGIAFTLVTSEEGAELTRIEKRINQLLTRVELPGFQAFTNPAEHNSEEKRAAKPVYGRSVRHVRRAL